MNKHHGGPAAPPSMPWALDSLSRAVLRVGRAGLKVTHQTAASCHCGRDGREGGREGEGGGSRRQPLHTPPSLHLTPLPRPKNSLAEDTFNNISYLKKKYSDKPSICPSPCLSLPGAMADTGVETLSAVGLLLFKQSHGQLGAGPQPLQIAEATSVVQFLTEPGAAVPQGELLHQPWLYGSKEVEP